MTAPHKFTSNTATIYHGHCLDVLKDVADGSVTLIFADPPYNIGKRFGDFKDSWPSDAKYAEWCYEWLEVCTRKLTPTGSLYVMTSTQAMPYLDLWLRERLTVMSRIVWHYDSSGVQAKRYFGSLYEPILFAVKDVENYTFNAADIEIEARTGAVPITATANINLFLTSLSTIIFAFKSRQKPPSLDWALLLAALRVHLLLPVEGVRLREAVAPYQPR